MYKKAIVAALSGGVDSTAAAWLIKRDLDRAVEEGGAEAGSVFFAGAMHYIWQDSRCCNAEMILKARAVCDRLEIPFYLLDLTALFRSQVVDDFAAVYKSGKTPNPCVRCNERVRFSGFYDEVKKELSRPDPVTGRPGIPPDTPLYLATGHYARLLTGADGTIIHQAKDSKKDQSYMLYRVPERVLPHLMFPLGEYTKLKAVEIARNAGLLDQASQRESQDACFVDGSYAEFLKEYDPAAMNPGQGNIVDTEGRIIGRHKGYIEYTVGQRKGLNLSDGPWYVKRLIPEMNHVVVAREAEAKTSTFIAEDCVWRGPGLFGETAVKTPVSCSVQVRYRSANIPCQIEGDIKSSVLVRMQTPAIVTPGQSAVFYEGTGVLGGGIIAS